MKRFTTCFVLVLALAVAGVSAGSGPNIRIIDDRVSIEADAVPLSRLLRLLDQATGTASKVPPELANRNISVRFSNLSFEEAIHKIFEGQALDYVVVDGKNIIVTGTSQSVAERNTAGGPPSPPPVQETFNEEYPRFLQPRQPGPLVVADEVQNQPGVIQSSFGPMLSPRANDQVQQQGVNPIVPPRQIAPNPSTTPSQNLLFNPPSSPNSPPGTLLPTLQMRQPNP